MLKVDNSIVIVVYKEWMKQVCMSYISMFIYIFCLEEKSAYSHLLIFKVLSLNI